MFSQFRIESNNGNEIWLEIQLEGLLKVLRSCEASGQLEETRSFLRADRSCLWS